MKKYFIWFFAIMLCLPAIIMASCSIGIETKSLQEIIEDIPEEYLAMTVEGTRIVLPVEESEIYKRSTDIEAKKDDVYVSIVAFDGSYYKKFSLHMGYNYYETGGWILDYSEYTEEVPREAGVRSLPSYIFDNYVYSKNILEITERNDTLLDDYGGGFEIRFTTKELNDVGNEIVGTYYLEYDLARKSTHRGLWGGTVWGEWDEFEWIHEDEEISFLPSSDARYPLSEALYEIQNDREFPSAEFAGDEFYEDDEKMQHVFNFKICESTLFCDFEGIVTVTYEILKNSNNKNWQIESVDLSKLQATNWDVTGVWKGEYYHDQLTITVHDFSFDSDEPVATLSIKMSNEYMGYDTIILDTKKVTGTFTIFNRNLRFESKRGSNYYWRIDFYGENNTVNCNYRYDRSLASFEYHDFNLTRE